MAIDQMKLEKSAIKLKEKLENHLIKARMKRIAKIECWVGIIFMIPSIIWRGTSHMDFFALILFFHGVNTLRIIALFDLLKGEENSLVNKVIG